MTSIEKVFNELEEQALFYRSLNNEMNISISASDYLDIKRLAKEMHKQELFEYWQGGINCTEVGGKSFDQYYQETFGSKGSGMSEKPNNHTNSEIPNHIVESNKMVEISDEEIEKGANYFYPLLGEQSKKALWINGCKWYREQLKQK